MFDPDDLERLQATDVVAACRTLADRDPHAVALQRTAPGHWPLAAMAELIDARQRAASKLPGWPVADLLFDRLGIEQCSHLTCARWRAGCWPGGRLLDVCGGLGIDSACWAAAGRRVRHCERDPVRHRLAVWNHHRLGLAAMIGHHHGDGLEQIHDNSGWDAIFLDPDRRGAGRRTVDLSRLDPSPVAHHQTLRAAATTVIYKLAPATEDSDIRRLIDPAAAVSWISLDGELKECQVICGGDARPSRSAVCLTPDGPAWTLTDDGTGPLAPAGNPRHQALLILCDPALTKARLGCTLACRQGWRACRPASGLYLADDPPAAELPVRYRHILAVTTCRGPALRRLCRERGIPPPRIVDRGAGIAVAALQQAVGPPRTNDHQILCTRDPAGARVALLLALPDTGARHCHERPNEDPADWR